VSGKSLVKYALAAATNQPVEAIDAKARAAGCYYIVSPSEFFGKTYKVLNGWEEIASSPLVDAAAVDIKPGDIIPPHIDERSWIASVRYHANTVTEAEAFRQKLLETVHVSE
jgi:hypothetical protein